MESESITEGWVKFTRRHFAEGYIDRYMGDQMDNPNNKSKSQLSINALSTWYRVSGSSEWVNSRSLFKMAEHWQMTDLPAEMIWDNCYHDYQKVLPQTNGN